MKRFGSFAFLIMTLILSLMTVGCGGSSSSEGNAAIIVDSGESALRLINGSDNNGAVRVLVDGEVVEVLEPGEAVGYLPYDPGVHSIQVVDATTRAEGDLLAETQVNLNESTAYTFAVTGNRQGVAGFLFTDSTNRTGEGAFKLRVISSSTDLGPVDIYLIGVDDLTIGDEAPFYENLTFGGDSDYLVTPVGNYQLVLANQGTKDIVTRIPIIDPPSQSIISVIAIDRQGVGGPFQIFEITRE